LRTGPAEAATRERRSALFHGPSEVEEGKGALVREVVWLLVEEARDGKATDALGRGCSTPRGSPSAPCRWHYRQNVAGDLLDTQYSEAYYLKIYKFHTVFE
jgi:hypothetical protein